MWLIGELVTSVIRFLRSWTNSTACTFQNPPVSTDIGTNIWVVARCAYLVTMLPAAVSAAAHAWIAVLCRCDFAKKSGTMTTQAKGLPRDHTRDKSHTIRSFSIHWQADWFLHHWDLSPFNCSPYDIIHKVNVFDVSEHFSCSKVHGVLWRQPWFHILIHSCVVHKYWHQVSTLQQHRSSHLWVSDLWQWRVEPEAYYYYYSFELPSVPWFPRAKN